MGGRNYIGRRCLLHHCERDLQEHVDGSFIFYTGGSLLLPRLQWPLDLYDFLGRDFDPKGARDRSTLLSPFNASDHTFRPWSCLGSLLEFALMEAIVVGGGLAGLS